MSATSSPIWPTDLAAYLGDIEVDPARLAWVQQRRADLAGLTRRYGETVDDVLAWGQHCRRTARHADRAPTAASASSSHG